jgi:hypothetical protein
MIGQDHPDMLTVAAAEIEDLPITDVGKATPKQSPSPQT